MGFSDIIHNNLQKYGTKGWWTRFAFHYTDVRNAVSILSSARLYSRAYAGDLMIMRNDNASRQVIDMTHSEVVSKVRFYFRPLTPTQYYNEGYKHPLVRYCGDTNANVPVPIFFLFNLEKLLSMPETEFSEQTLAGEHGELLKGEKHFAGLNFDCIYNNEPSALNDTKKYRHAEIVYPHELNIDSCIEHIICRNDTERLTLLNLLRESNALAYEKYKSLIKVYNTDVFYNNGLYVSNCDYYNNTLVLSLSFSSQASSYVRKFRPSSFSNIFTLVDVKLAWRKGKSILKEVPITLKFDYDAPCCVNILKNNQEVSESDNLSIKISFDGKLVCYLVKSLNESGSIF